FLNDYKSALTLLFPRLNDNDNLLVIYECIEKLEGGAKQVLANAKQVLANAKQGVKTEDITFAENRKRVYEKILLKSNEDDSFKKFAKQNNIALKLIEMVSDDKNEFMKISGKYLVSEIIDKNHPSVKIYMEKLIDSNIESGNFEEAIQFAETFSDLIGRDKLNSIKFKHYSIQKKYEDAEKYLEYGTADEKNNALKNLAVISFSKRDYAKSYKLFSQLPESCGLSEEEYFKYAASGIKTGNTGKIIPAIFKINSFNNEERRLALKNAADYCIGKKMWNEAGKLIELNPEKDSKYISDAKILIYENTGEYEKLLKTVESGKYSDNGKVLKIAAESAKKKNNTGEYIKYLIQLFKLEKNQTHSEIIADYYFNNNDFKNASLYYETASRSVKNLRNLAASYYSLEKFEKSLEKYSELEKIEPQNRETLLKMAELSVKLDYSDKIIESFDKLKNKFSYKLSEPEIEKLGIAYYKIKSSNETDKLRYFMKSFELLKIFSKPELNKTLIEVSDFIASHFIKSKEIEKSLEYAEMFYSKTGSLKFADDLLKYYMQKGNDEKTSYWASEKEKNGIQLDGTVLKRAAEINIKSGDYETAYKRLSEIKGDDDYILSMLFECAVKIGGSDKIKQINRRLIEKSFESKRIETFCFENKIAQSILDDSIKNNFADFEKYYGKLVNLKYMSETEMRRFALLKAERLYSEKNYGESLKLLEKFENDFSDSSIGLLFKSYFSSGNDEKVLSLAAASEIKGAVKLPEELRMIIEKSRRRRIKELFEGKKYKESLAQINLLENKDAEIANIEFSAYYNLSNFDNAYLILEKYGDSIGAADGEKLNVSFGAGKLSEADGYADKLISEPDKSNSGAARYEALKIKFDISRIGGDTATANNCLFELLKYPDTEKYYVFKQIEYYYQNNDYKKTIELFKNSRFDVKSISLSEKSQIYAGMSLYYLENYFDSYKYLGDAKIQKSLDKKSFYILAYSAYKIGKLQESWKLFTMMETDGEYAGAIKTLKKDIYIQLGNLNMAASEYGKAVENFKNAMQYGDSDSAVLIKLADAYYNLKSFSAAADIYKKLDKKNFKTPELNLQFGWSLYYIGKEEDAAPFLAAGIASTGDYNELLKIAEISEKYLPPEKSIELYVAARNLFKNYDLNRKLGDLFYRINDLLNAARQYNIYLSQNTKTAELLGKLSDIYFKLGNKPELVKCLEESIKLDSSDFSKFKTLGDLFSEINDLKKAKEYYEKYAVFNGSDSALILKLSRIFYETGEYSKSSEYYEIYLKFDNAKVNADDLFKAGSSYFRLAEKSGDGRLYAEAFEKFNRIGLNDKTRFFLIQSAKSGSEYFYDKAEYSKAEELAKKHYIVSSSAGIIINLYSKLIKKHFESGDFRQTIGLAKKYLEINKENPEIFAVLAESFDKLNESGAARYYYFLSYKLNFKIKETSFRLAELYEKIEPPVSAYYYEQYEKFAGYGVQEIRLKLADLYYSEKNYAKAAQYFEKAGKLNNPDLIEKKIESYKKINNPALAAKHILEYFELTSDYSPEKLEYLILFYFDSRKYSDLIGFVNKLNAAAKSNLKRLNYNIGLVFWNNKENKNAFEYFAEYEKSEDKSRNDYSYYLGEIYYEKSEYVQSLKYYNIFTGSVSSNDIRYYPSLFKIIKMSYELQKYEDCEKSIEKLETGINSFNENMKKDFYYMAGVAYYQSKKIEKAEKYFDKLSGTNFNLAVPYSAMGFYYYDKSNFEKALNYFSKVSQSTDDPKVFKTLADIYLKLGNKDSAEKFYLKLYSLQPSEANAVITAGFYNSTGNSNKAAEFYKYASKFNPSNAESLYFLGTLYFNLKNYQNASGFFSSLSALKHNYKGIGEKLAKSYFEIGDFRKCAAEYSAISDKSQTQNYEFAFSLMKTEKYREALKYFDEMLLDNKIPVELKAGVLKCAAESYFHIANKIDSKLIQYYDNLIKTVFENKILEKEFSDYLGDVLIKTADFYFNLKDYQKSYKYFSLLGSLTDKKSEQIENFALSAFYIKNYKDASRLFNGLIMNSKNGDSLKKKYYFYSGLCSYYLNNFEQSVSELEKSSAFVSKPEDAQISKIIGKMLVFNNDYKKAEPYLEFAAVKLKEPESYNLLAETYLKFDKKKEAADIIQKSLELDGNQNQLFLMAGDLHFEFGNLSAAAQYYGKLFDGFTGKPDSKTVSSFIKFASIYFDKGIYKKSFDILNKLFESGISDFKLNYNLALSAVAVQKLEYASKLFAACEKFDFKPALYYYYYGELSARLGRFAEAEKQILRAVELESGNFIF
ncbi:MAG TPA: hypothetical protein PLQ81_01825, partial [bacterium]|nr:hypothetical protein [bacterium]